MSTFECNCYVGVSRLRSLAQSRYSTLGQESFDLDDLSRDEITFIKTLENYGARLLPKKAAQAWLIIEQAKVRGKLAYLAR